MTVAKGAPDGRSFPRFDTPQDVSTWERLSRMRWKAAVREGTVYQRETHVLQVRTHVATVEAFIEATRASLADSMFAPHRDDQLGEPAPFVWVHRR